MPKPKKVNIVEAVGVASGHRASGNAGLSKVIEQAMIAAAAAAQAEGITDPDEVRARILAAREAAKAAAAGE